ncbi:MAG: 50S ribosomal protein L34e [Candidatus Woesearchaeota archaeon]
MPAPNKRSRTFRRVFKTSPGGKNKIHYLKRKPGKAKCGKCGAILAGVPNQRPYKMQNMAKTAKRPSRPFGGVLCSRCMRALLKEGAK